MPSNYQLNTNPPNLIPPLSWIIRWGMTIVFLSVVAFVVTLALLKFPQTISANGQLVLVYDTTATDHPIKAKFVSSDYFVFYDTLIDRPTVDNQVAFHLSIGQKAQFKALMPVQRNGERVNFEGQVTEIYFSKQDSNSINVFFTSTKKATDKFTTSMSPVEGKLYFSTPGKSILGAFFTRFKKIFKN